MLGLGAPAMRPGAFFQRPNEFLVDATHQQIRHFAALELNDISDIIFPLRRSRGTIARRRKRTHVGEVKPNRDKHAEDEPHESAWEFF